MSTTRTMTMVATAAVIAAGAIAIPPSADAYTYVRHHYGHAVWGTYARATRVYAADHYYAVGPAPVFTYAAATCGKSVTGTVTFDFMAIIYQASIPLTASACFP